MLRILIAVAALPLLAGAALAQTAVPPNSDNPARELPYDRGYDKPTARGDAINAQEGPVTDQLNAHAAALGTAQNMDAKAQYDADQQAYLDALAAHDRAVDRTDARYARQRVAYADAMAAWRDQVRACQAGHRRACEMPAPTVADFY